MKYISSLLASFVLVLTTYAQVPVPVFEDKVPQPKFDEKLSTWVRDCTVGVCYPMDATRTSRGSGTIIVPQRKDGKWYILTADHCTGKIDTDVDIIFSNGKKVKGKVVGKDANQDIAWVITHDKDLKLNGAKLADKLPVSNQRVVHFGLGGRLFRRGNVQGDRYVISKDHLVWYKFPAVSGDSGCGIICENSKMVIGVLSCGNDKITGAGHALAARRLKSLVEEKLKDEE